MANSSRRTRIGVFIEWLSDGYSDPILEEIVSAAEERGVAIRCFVGGMSDRDYPSAKRHVPLVYASPQSIDGAVVVSMGSAFEPTDVEVLFRRFEAIPLCGMAVHWSQYPSIEVDNETGVRAGVRHLIQKHGRRKLAYIRGPARSTEAEKRFSAYRAVLADFGVPYDERYVAPGHYMRQHGADAVRLFLDDRKLEIDAIVAANDAMALGAIEELERRGIRIPESVALLGFDDVDEARYARPPLSTVRQPFRDHARGAFELVMKQLEGRRHGLDLSFAIIDLDHFKTINDTYGHLAGDGVLRQVAVLLAEHSRCTDLVGRYGGEELCLVLAHTSMEDAIHVAEKLRKAIAGLEFSSDGHRFGVTASIGVAQAVAEDESIVDIVRRADRALYRAKNNGRNRVERASIEDESSSS